MIGWRGPFGVTFRRCVAVAGPLSVAAAALAAVGGWLTEPAHVGSPSAAGAVTPWLALPLLVASVACCLVAAQTWPTFTLRRDGADAVRRIARGPFGGRARVALGAVAAQLVICAPVLLTLPAALGVDSKAFVHQDARPPESPVLDRAGAHLAFVPAAPLRTRAVWLRPRAALPTGPAPTRLELTASGSALATAPIEFVESLELVRVAIDEQVIEAVELTQLDGDVPLLFSQGSVVLVGADARPRWQNSLLLAAITCAPTLLTLTAAALLGLIAGWATVASAIGALQFVQWIGGVGPVGEAVQAFARGHWLL